MLEGILWISRKLKQCDDNIYRKIMLLCFQTIFKLKIGKEFFLFNYQTLN